MIVERERIEFPLELLAGLTASGWDESEHPRDPGGQGGGEFIKKGAVGEFDPVPKLMMHGLGEKNRRELAAIEDEIRALPIPENNLSHDYGITPTEEQPEAGGMDFYRSSGGRYHLSGAMIDGVIMRDTADEIIQAAHEQLAVALEVGEQNWRSRLRGHTMTKRNSPEVFAVLEQAQAYNDSSPAWTSFAEKWGVVEQPIVLKEEGMKRMGKDVLTNGFYAPENDNVFFSGDFMKMSIDLHNNPNSVLSKLDLVGPTYPGSPGSTTADHLIRHEYAHKAYARWSPRQRAEFLAMVPKNKDMLRELSGYAAASEEYYGGRTFGDGVFPWQGEVFAEAVASVTQPKYDRERWAPWIAAMGDWILEQEPE